VNWIGKGAVSNHDKEVPSHSIAAHTAHEAAASVGQSVSLSYGSASCSEVRT